jgi:hypothetical protein
MKRSGNTIDLTVQEKFDSPLCFSQEFNIFSFESPQPVVEEKPNPIRKRSLTVTQSPPPAEKIKSFTVTSAPPPTELTASPYGDDLLVKLESAQPVFPHSTSEELLAKVWSSESQQITTDIINIERKIEHLETQEDKRRASQIDLHTKLQALHEDMKKFEDFGRRIANIEKHNASIREIILDIQFYMNSLPEIKK